MKRYVVVGVVLCTLALTSAAARPASAPPSPIRFPADTAMHPSATTEWWYVVGHLADAGGRSFGFETTLFKFSGLRRYFKGSPVDTAFRTDVALTDEAAHAFHRSVVYVPSVAGATIADTESLRLRAGTVSIRTVGPLSYHVEGKTNGGSVDLTVLSTRAPMLVDGGYQHFAGGYTYYYSLTRMKTTGTVTIGARRLQVHGVSWMDHQWGNWDWSTIIGWDWMSMQLSDGSDLSLDVERTTLGNVHWAMELTAHGRQIYVPQSDVTPLGRWRSPQTGITYPSGWHVRVPRLGLDVVIRPTVKDQELVDTFGVDKYEPAYWEGSSTVLGTHSGHPVTGKAYVELTGYGTPPPSPRI